MSYETYQTGHRTKSVLREFVFRPRPWPVRGGSVPAVQKLGPIALRVGGVLQKSLVVIARSSLGVVEGVMSARVVRRVGPGHRHLERHEFDHHELRSARGPGSHVW